MELKIAWLNYTYGTNGIPVPKPAKVNLIDKKKIAHDVAKAKALNPDLIIAFVHWGTQFFHQTGCFPKSFGKNIFIIWGVTDYIPFGSTFPPLVGLPNRWVILTQRDQVLPKGPNLALTGFYFRIGGKFFIELTQREFSHG